MKKRAILIISGKILERSFPIDALEEIRRAIETRLADRDVVLSRCAATLCGERHLAAPFWLAAGFEVVPADDEDSQATALLLSEAFSQNPPDEVVVAFGMKSEPVNVLRSVAGRVRRIALRFPSEDESGPSSDLLGATEEIADVRTDLSKIGVDWSALESRPWSEWLEQIFDPFAAASPVPPRLGGEIPTLERETEASPGPAEEVPVSEPEPEKPVPQVDVDEEIKRRAVEEFSASASEWNEALAELLAARGHCLKAYVATEELDGRFPGLFGFSMTHRDEFANLLCGNLRLLVEDGVMWLYDEEHPDMTFLDARDAARRLDVGSQAAEEPERERPKRFDWGAEPKTFREVAELADLSKRFCLWRVERARLVEDPESADLVAERDARFADAAALIGLRLWQARPDVDLDEPALREFANCFDLLSRSILAFDEVAKELDSFPTEFVARAAQLAINAQCLVKSTLVKRGVSIGCDDAQRSARNMLRDFLASYDPKTILKNFRKEDLVDLDAREGFFAELDAIVDKTGEFLEVAKGRKRAWSKLSYHAEQLKDAPTFGAERHWAKIVEATTELCEEYGEKSSSVRLREALRDLIADVPEEVETTDAFCQVVQQIDEFVERERESALSEPESGEEATISPELRAVRERYAGSKMVFIGGTPQDHLRERLEKQFQMEILWSQFDHGDSLDRLSPYVRDPDVKLFVIYIPWCSHKHSEEFTAVLKSMNKDYVRQPKGTNPEAIAQSICKQIGLL
ncbi:MAG: hypothetical protein IJM30_11295 [Thermoguttaceae bacterium]|nr:hypothetical protein [Thermoguttaceae bacterium]